MGAHQVNSTSTTTSEPRDAAPSEAVEEKGLWAPRFLDASDPSASRSDRIQIASEGQSVATSETVASSEIEFMGNLPAFRSNEFPDGTPRWFRYVTRRLGNLEHYPESGDEASYPKPPSQTVEKAWLLVYDLFEGNTPTPSVVPADEGGVEFAWHKSGWDLVISVLAEETSVWARNLAVGVNWSCPLSESLGRVQNILRSLN
jgi:hypothetical protein